VKRDSSLHGRWSCTDNLTDHLSIRILDHLVLLALVLDCAQAATRVAPHRVIHIRTAHLRLLLSEQIGQKVTHFGPAQAFVPRLKGNNWELCRGTCICGRRSVIGIVFLAHIGRQLIDAEALRCGRNHRHHGLYL
jgi:hypothetical protein